MRTAGLWLWSIILGLCLTGLLIYRLSRSPGAPPPLLSKKHSLKPLRAPAPPPTGRSVVRPISIHRSCGQADPPPPPPWASMKSSRGRKKADPY